VKGPHCLLSAHCLHTLSTRCLVEASRLHVGVEASRLGVEVSRILYVNHGWSHRGKRRGCVEVSRLRRGHASILHRACIEPNVEDVEARAQRSAAYVVFLCIGRAHSYGEICVMAGVKPAKYVRSAAKHARNVRNAQCESRETCAKHVRNMRNAQCESCETCAKRARNIARDVRESC